MSNSGLANGTGQAKIAVTGTAVQLPVNSTNNGTIITALSTNTNPIIIGNSSVTNVADGTGNGYILEPGNSISTAKLNLSDYWINGTSGDIVSFIGS